MKKTAYLTDKNWEKKTLFFYKKAACFGEKRKLEIDPESTAFLILDMQEYFLSPESPAFIPSSPALIDRIREFQILCRENDLPVLFTQHINTEENAGMMKLRWHRLIYEGDPLGRITERLDYAGSFILRKSQYDAFHGTDLNLRLKEMGVKTVIIAGVMANLCCETTARSAFVRGFQSILPIDLTAAYNEELHLSTVINLAHGFTGPFLASQIKDALWKK